MQIVDVLWSDLLCRNRARDKVEGGNYTASQGSRRVRDEDWNGNGTIDGNESHSGMGE